MRLLLDTHIFIWLAGESDALPPWARSLCEDTGNELWLSVASVWEMQIKHQLGKLPLSMPLAELVGSQGEANGVALLGIALRHVLALEALPPLHGDPFDRLLIAQARVEGLALLTADDMLLRYDVRIERA